MPDLNTIPPADLADLRAQGLSDQQIQALGAPIQAPPPNNPGILSTIGQTARAHLGGYAGGGAGMIAGIQAGALAGLPAEGVGAIPGAIIGGLLGGLGGQAVQDKVTPTWEQGAQEAAQANPNTALATDIIGGSLGGGGQLSLDALLAGRGLIGASGSAVQQALDRKLIPQVAMNSLLNPAINAGLNLATGQGLPSGKDLIAQTLGGAAFGRQSEWMSRALGHSGEPKPEVNNGSGNTDNDIQETKELESPFNRLDVSGNYAIGNKRIKQLYLKSDGIIKPIPDGISDIDKAILQTQNDNTRNNSDYGMMRDYLHQQHIKSLAPQTDLPVSPLIGEQLEQQAEPKTEVNQNSPEQPIVVPKPENQQVNQEVAQQANQPVPPAKTEDIVPKPSAQTPETNIHGESADDLQKEIYESGQVSAPPPEENQPHYISNAADMVQNSEQALKLRPNNSGAFHGTQLLGTLFNKLSPTEQDIYKQAGIIQHFQNRYISKPDAVKWLQDNTPKVEVRKFGEGGQSPESKELNQLTHKFDTLGKDPYDNTLQWTPEQQRDRQRMMELSKMNLGRGNNSHWQSTAPKSEKDMQGYVEIAVTKPGPTKFENPVHQNLGKPNTLGWVRGYMETLPPLKLGFPEVKAKLNLIKNGEDYDVVYDGKRIGSVNKGWTRNGGAGWVAQLPEHQNILTKKSLEDMRHSIADRIIQANKKNSPQGEKVFHVIELQSDWAAKLQDAKERRDLAIKRYTERLDNATEEAAKIAYRNQIKKIELDYQDTLKQYNDPLLAHHERLVLKAAIDHARSEGATKIAISDAETAMMTEGHDSPHNLRAVVIDRKTGQRLMNPTSYEQAQGYYKEWKKHNPDGMAMIKQEIGQEPGMRLHYDRTLPKIASELTGSKGEPVNLGEHKMAFDKTGYLPNVTFTTEQKGIDYLNNLDPNWETSGRYELKKSTLDGKWRIEDLDSSPYRKDLIFKNPDGTPKTTITGRKYDISNVPDRQPKLFGKNYALPPENPQIHTPEFKQWFGESKIVDKDGKPLVVYHGSFNKFDIFDTKQGRGNKLGIGSYFTDNPDRTYNYGGKFNLYKTYLSIKNPYIINYGHDNIHTIYAKIPNTTKDDIKFEIAERHGMGMKPEDVDNISTASEWLRQKGYDGIIQNLGDRGHEYVVFDPRQVKSSTDNSGTFDPNNPSIVHTTPNTNSTILNPLTLQHHILSGRATTGSVLQHLANAEGHPFQPLAKALLDTSDTRSLGVKWFHDNTLDKPNGARSHYDTINDRVNIGTGSAGDSRTVLEEAIHSMTAKKIPVFGGQGEEHYNRLNTYLKTGSNDSVKDLIKAYFETAKKLGIHDALFTDHKDLNDGSDLFKGLAGNPDAAVKGIQGVGHTTKYAMGSLDEFIAQAFKDERFQTVLNSIKTTDGRTVWQKIVDSVRGLLGLKPEMGSMLDRVLRTSGELINQERPEEGGAFVRRDYGGESGRFAAPKEEERIPTAHMGKFGGLVESVLDKVREIPHPMAGKVADAFQSALIDKDRLEGKYRNPAIESGAKLTSSDKQHINQVMEKDRVEGKYHPELMQNDAQRNFYNTNISLLRRSGEEMIKRQVPVIQNGTPRLMIQKEGHWSNMANQKMEDLFRQNTDLPKMQAAQKEFEDFYKKELQMSPADAHEYFENWKTSIQGNLRGSDISHQDYFNAIRKAQGKPLPESFREQDPVKNQQRYFDRLATAAAHYTNVESNPKVMSSLGATKDAWNRQLPKDPNGSLSNNANVKHAIAQFHVVPQSTAAQTEGGGSGLATALMIAQPGLEIHKIGSNIVRNTTFDPNPITAARRIGVAIKNCNAGYQHAKAQGLIKLTATSVWDMFNPALTNATRLNSLAKLVRDISTLGGMTTYFNTGFQQAWWEQMIPSMMHRAASDTTTAAFLKHLDPSYEMGKIYDEKWQQATASIAAKYTHGTGDIRQLPGWMMNESEVSGFFQLAHWSVAQTNNFFHDVWTPATRGNYAPLITSVFGATAGGYIIGQLRHEIQGKKGQIPSLGEIAASDRGLEGNKPLLMYNAIAAMQYAGFGGLLSQVAKYPFDFAYKNTPQGATFPLDEVGSDLLTTFKQVSTAIANDPNVNWVDLAQAVTTHMFGQTIGLSKVAINQMIDNGLITGLPAEKKALSDKLGQLRRFDEAEGLPYNELDEASNPFMNIEQKRFKLDQNPQTAMQQLPQLVGNIIQTYHGQPDIMMNKLKSLKENAYQTFPSMEDTPISFYKYLGYLQREEGSEAAQAELRDYMQHKLMNAAKSSAVP